MSIHEEIKRRREVKGWSHERLAAEVSELQGLKKPLAWQTVQQWENGKSAPTRKRLPYVARALGCTPEDLAFPTTIESPSSPGDADTAKQGKPFPSLPPDKIASIYANLGSSGQEVFIRLLDVAGLLPAQQAREAWPTNKSQQGSSREKFVGAPAASKKRGKQK